MAQRWWILIAVACGTFMSTLDASIMNIAVDTLIHQFRANLISTKWVIAGYFLVLTGFLLPLGRLSDVVGRKRIFSIGFGIFTLGSLLCSVAPNLGLLITFRVVQALGASMLMANGPAIITSVFPPKERGRALGTLAMVVSLGLISGPSIGAYLMELLSWRSVFLMNLPLGLAGIFLIQKNLPSDTPDASSQGFDIVGALLQLFGLFFLAMTFDGGKMLDEVFGFRQFGRLVFVLGATLSFSLFWLHERRTPNPVLDVTLFQNPTFRYSNLGAFFVFIAYAGVGVLLPYFLQHELRFTPKHAGTLMATIPMVAFFAAPLSGMISDRRGSRELTVIGCALMTAMLMALALTLEAWESSAFAEARVALFLGLIGLSMAMFQTPNNNAIMSAVPASKLSAASALIATTRNMGIVIGTGLATNIFSWKYEFSQAGGSALRWTLISMSLFTLAGTLASLRNRKGPFEV